jgi:YspA, cpYpsA-related SLOG family
MSSEHLPEFRVAITGSPDFADPGTVAKALADLLARKPPPHTAVLLCGNDGPGRLAAKWAEVNGVDHEHLPDPSPQDSTGSFRNTAVLDEASEFVVFRSAKGWPVVVEDLVNRARTSGRQVRVIEV